MVKGLHFNLVSLQWRNLPQQYGPHFPQGRINIEEPTQFEKQTNKSIQNPNT